MCMRVVKMLESNAGMEKKKKRKGKNERYLMGIYQMGKSSVFKIIRTVVWIVRMCSSHHLSSDLDDTH